MTASLTLCVVKLQLQYAESALESGVLHISNRLLNLDEAVGHQLQCICRSKFIGHSVKYNSSI